MAPLSKVTIPKRKTTNLLLTMKKILFLLTILTLLLTACGTSTTSNAGGAPKAVENYLAAITSKKLDQVQGAACAAWEARAKIEFDSFQAVAVKLDSVACQEAGTSGNFTLVKCTGKLVATYQNENQTLDLSRQTYRAVQEGGAWKMCGYQE